MHTYIVGPFCLSVSALRPVSDQGTDAARRCFHGFHDWLMKEAVGAEGAMMQHTLAIPVIEIAGDGQTAKGVWMSPGHEAHTIDGKQTSIWCWGTYGEDFIKENGQWKIRNHHVYLNRMSGSPTGLTPTTGSTRPRPSPSWSRFRPSRTTPTMPRRTISSSSKERPRLETAATFRMIPPSM
jgi:SnoaL-like domain